MNTPSHDDVRKLAFMKWEAAGRPEGQELEHWLAAEREILTQAEAVAVEMSATVRKAAPSKRAAAAPQAAKTTKAVKADAGPKKAPAKRTTKKKEV